MLPKAWKAKSAVIVILCAMMKCSEEQRPKGQGLPLHLVCAGEYAIYMLLTPLWPALAWDASHGARRSFDMPISIIVPGTLASVYSHFDWTKDQKVGSLCSVYITGAYSYSTKERHQTCVLYFTVFLIEDSCTEGNPQFASFVQFKDQSGKLLSTFHSSWLK